jgi:type VI secretion system protein ImpL
MSATWWPYALAAVLLLALAIVVLLVMLLKKAAKATRFADADEPPAEEAPEAKKEKPQKGEGGEAVGIGAAFRRAAQHLKESRDGQFDAVPLFLLAGAELSREPDLLGTSRVDLPFGYPDEAEMSLGEGRGFWFFDTGVILDVAGAQVLRADGRTSDEGGWSSILKHLRRLRPKRPLDGALVTIPATDLIDADVNEKARTDFASRMTRVNRKLIDAQRQLGFRVPCYIVITGCERLSGFASLCAELPSASREQMLGWSSPYSIESAYRSTWADEAIAACADRLDEVQLEAFADGTDQPASLLHFPNTIRGLAAPLRVCLDQLFRSSAYHGALIMRGVYFCGREEDQSDANALTPRAQGETAFLRDLIEQKVFAERALARPTAGMITQRHRAVRIVQAATVAAALLFGFGLWHSYYLLRHQNEVVAPFLRYRARMTEATQQIASASQTSETRLDGPARDLLDALAQIDFQHYGSWFLPDTWFSPLRGRIDDSIENAFRDVILEGIRFDLKEEAKRLTGPSGAFEIVEAAPVRVPLGDQSTLNAAPQIQPQSGQALIAAAAAGAEAPIVPIESMPQFRALQTYVNQVMAFEEVVGTFNRLVGPQAGNLKELGVVVKHSFDKDLPRQFYTESHLYENALKKATAPPFDLSPYRASAALRAQQLARELYGALYGGNAFARRLQQLSLRLHQASTQWPSPLDTAAFAELVQRQRDIETQLSRPELEWAFHRDFDLGPHFNALLLQMNRSQLLGVGVVATIRGEGQEGLWQFQRGLASTTSPLTGPLLAMDRDSRPLMQLSPDTLLLKSAVESFIGEGFVGSRSEGRRIAAHVPEGMRLVWDGRLLEQSSGVSQAYDRFRSKTLDVFPVELRGSIDSVARERAQARMTDLVSQAQKYAPIVPPGSATSVEEQLRWDVGSFSATMQPVLDNLDAFTRQGSSQPRQDLAEATTSEASRLLRSVDQLLEVDAPYRPRRGNFEWWDGAAPPSPAAWDGRDPADVAAYLEVTRARVTVLARNYAQPLLTWFTKAGTRDEPEVRNLAAKWQGILDDLRDYDAKKPGNSLSALEEYIGGQMPKVGTANCNAASAPQLRSRTFFAVSLNELSTQLSGRCYEVAGSSANARYAELARYFNQRLAGHYPFAEGLPRSQDREADPEDVRAFFGLYDKTQALVRAMPNDAAPWVPAARKFIGDMAAVRGFFAPFLDAEKPVPAPSFDVEATFRILREREIEGDQIIAWTLQVGDQTVTNRDKSKKLRWTVGDPLRLSLRWANEAPRIPMLPSPQRGVSVTDRTVSYNYTNQWSLVSALIERRAPADLLPDYADLQPVTLSLSIFTQQVLADGKGEGKPFGEPSRVFLRVTPLAPGTTQPLEPPRFPVRAPRPDAIAPASFDAWIDPNKEAV